MERSLYKRVFCADMNWLFFPACTFWCKPPHSVGNCTHLNASCLGLAWTVHRAEQKQLFKHTWLSKYTHTRTHTGYCLTHLSLSRYHCPSLHSFISVLRGNEGCVCVLQPQSKETRQPCAAASPAESRVSTSLQWHGAFSVMTEKIG